MIIIASFLSYKFVEKPFRTSKYRLRVLVIPMILILGMSLFGDRIQKYQYSEYEWNIFKSFSDQDNYRCGKVFRIKHPFSTSCLIGENESASMNSSLMLIGNSHANSIKKSFAKVANSSGYSVHFLVGNDPLTVGGSTAQQVFREIRKVKASTIVLHYSQDGFSNEELVKLNNLCLEDNIRVVFIMPVVHWTISVPEGMVKNLENGSSLPIQTLSEYTEKNKKLTEFLESQVNIQVYPTTNYLCQISCQVADNLGHPYYLDANHLTLTGSRLLIPLFENIFR